MANDFPNWLRVSAFRREADENCALLCCYAASSDNSLSTFRENLSAPSSWPFNMGPIGCPETSVRKHHYLLCNISEERSPHPDEFLSIPSQLSNHTH